MEGRMRRCSGAKANFLGNSATGVPYVAFVRAAEKQQQERRSRTTSQHFARGETIEAACRAEAAAAPAQGRTAVSLRAGDDPQHRIPVERLRREGKGGRRRGRDG